MGLYHLYHSFLTYWRQIEQFVIIIVGFWCMGAGCGFERSLLPRMAVQVFHETDSSTRLNFVATFGLSKAIANVVSGPLADRFGRKPTLVLGCLVGLPVMPYIIFAKSWGGITLMNCAFGFSQGLCGSALFFLLIDVMGPSRRGIAVGLGECSIYVSTAVVNIVAGVLASGYGFRPVPFYYATGFSVVGLLSTIPLKDTLDQVRKEQTASERESRKLYARMMSTQPSKMDLPIVTRVPRDTIHGLSSLPEHALPWQLSNHERLYVEDTGSEDTLPLATESEETLPLVTDSEETLPLFNEKGENYEAISMGPSSANGSERATDIVWNGEHFHPIEPDGPVKTLKRLLFHNPSFVTLCLGGMVINFKDGFAWGSFPVFFKHEHFLSDADTDYLVALYPLCWGLTQAFSGALSDRFGRKIFLVTGLASCAVAMALYAVPNRLWGAVGDYRHIRVWRISDVLLGLGTALAYPALQVGAADEVDPINRGLALGFYRFTRDMGYVVGAVVCGRLTDAIGYEHTFLVVAFLLLLSTLSIVLLYQPKGANAFGTTNGATHTRKNSRVRILVHQCSDSW